MACANCHTELGHSRQRRVHGLGCHTTASSRSPSPATPKPTAPAGAATRPAQNMSAIKTASRLWHSRDRLPYHRHRGAARRHNGDKLPQRATARPSSATNPGTSPHHVASVTAKPVLTVKLSGSSGQGQEVDQGERPRVPGRASARSPSSCRGRAARSGSRSPPRPRRPTRSSAWSYSYKTTTKGSFRMQASTKAATGVSAGESALPRPSR